jgi:PEGA domain
VGLSPATAADTKPGTHRLRLDLEGYATQLRSVDNSDGEKLQVKRELEKRGTRFKVMSEVPVAVTLDEQMIGEGEEVAIPELSAGRYQMKVTAPGHKELTERVEVKGHAAWFEVELAPDTGSAASALRETGPFYTRWPFWTAVGGGTVVAVVGGVLIARAFEPVEIPSGDVVVVLP